MFKDRNSITGFILLVGLLIAYIVYNNYSQRKFAETERERKAADSIAFAKANPGGTVPATTPASPRTDTAPRTTPALDSGQMATLPPALRGGAGENVVLENSALAVTFSTKGAAPTAARIKGFQTYDKAPLDYFSGAGNGLSLTLPFDNGRSTTDLVFVPTSTTGPDGSKAVSFDANLGGGRRVNLTYSLPKEGNMLGLTVRLAGMPAQSLPLTWNVRALHTENDVTAERANAQVYYRYKNDDNDYFTVRSDERKALDENLHWVGLRTHYFSSALIADEGFGKTELSASINNLDKNSVAAAKTQFNLPVKGNGEASLRWYIGPNDYQKLKSYKIGLDDMVPLGYGLFVFVKYINKGLIIPVFNLLKPIGNYGVIIMLMTLFIRLILSFFTYKSYLSTAKMRVLKPELDELRGKYGDDQQRMGMEQMKLYRSAGVNPLGGCLPTLFQIPILFAMYYFFPSSIELRGESFLWANDLSTYDSILNLPFTIPFYGAHVSLFTLLMTASSLFLAVYNRNMTPQTADNPVLKYMPFVFPILLMGVFNKMAAALTFYYFFSNMISILQQFIIQKYVIDEKKIHARIQENRNKPATPSKWAARMEEIQKAQLEKAKGAKAGRK